MKIIVDTNIIISGLISEKSYPAQIVDNIYNDKFQVCLSQDIFEEYVNVLHRDKFQKYQDFPFHARLLLEFLSEKATYFVPKTSVNILKDPDDNKFLELALEANAEFIITGNTKDFTLSVFHNTQIISASEFINNYENI